MKTRGTGKGFTLIELLIVVAIIAILALIAVPNFLEAQTRAKVAREKNDLRTIAVALEAYNVDHGAYPPWNVRGTGLIHPASWRFCWLTTPVAFISSALMDPFAYRKEWDETDTAFGRTVPKWDTYDLVTWNGNVNDDPWAFSHAWRVNGFGPDYNNNFAGGRGWQGMPTPAGLDRFPNYIYDPTNGTVSLGDIIRVGNRTPLTTRGYHPIETLPQ
jgi:prepilin-type N-terminal cleavage/methylation domain-containing protein